MMHEDIAGTVIGVGDIVAYVAPRYRRLYKGKVIAITPKMVRIERFPNQGWLGGDGDLSEPSNLIVLDSAP